MKKILAVLITCLLAFTISAYGADKERGLYKDDGDFVDSQSVGMLTYGVYQSSPQSITDGDVGPVQLNANGILITAPTSSGATIASKTATSNLASAALDYTTNFAAQTRITSITLHADAAITETFTVKINSTTGANYDTTVLSESLTSTIISAGLIFLNSISMDSSSGSKESGFIETSSIVGLLELE